MKIKKLVKGLLTVVALGLFTTQANAVTLVAGQSYQLTGNINGISSAAGYSGIYSLTPSGSFSYFTVNFDNTVSVVLNLVQADGDKAVLKIDKLVLGGSGTALTMSAAAGVTTFSNGYKDIGDFIPGGNAALLTHFGIGMPGQLNTAANTFKIWGSYFNTAGTLLGGTDFHLAIGNNVTAQVPEPMTMSLLGMGLLGGAINRKRKVAA